MRMSLLSGTFLFASALAAQAQQLEPLTAAVNRVAHNLRLDGVALSVLRDAGEVHRSEHGKLGAQSAMPIASASKWLATATVMTLVDDGMLDLDVPVARYVTELARPDKEAVTLRQCLSCTSGFPVRLGGRMRGFGSKEFAAAVAKAPLRAGPGERFLYGGVGFQVAAIAAERVSGKTFHKLFAERIADPLGLQTTSFGALRPLGSDPATTKLPWAAGGAVSSLADYAKFVRMLLAGGRVGDRQLLSDASVKAMFTDQVSNQAEVRSRSIDAPVRYGLGTWIVELDDGGKRVMDPGAFGFTPWIDLDLGIGAVFAVHDRVGRVMAHLPALQDEVRKIALSPLVAGDNTTVDLAFGGRDRRYHLHVPARSANVAAMPLVVVLHGGGGNGEGVARSTRFAELADREGFVVAFPDGTGPLRHRLLTWNSGGLPVYAADHRIDDTAFLREVVTDIARRVAIDHERIYAVGHSNGGMMCHRLAREAADVFAGIAVVAGAMNFTAADAASPIGVLIVHGTEDQNVRYTGGAPRAAGKRAANRVDASVQDAIDYYKQRNGLHGYPESMQEPANAKVRIDTYGKRNNGQVSWSPLRLLTLDGGGHAWPGASGPARAVGDRPFDYDATKAIWDFFLIVKKSSAGQTPSVPR